MARTLRVATACDQDDVHRAPLRRSPRKKTVNSRHDYCTDQNHVDGAQAGNSAPASSKQLIRASPSEPVCNQSYAKSSVLREINLSATSDVDEVETIITSAQRSRLIRPSPELACIVSEMDGLSLNTRLSQARSTGTKTKSSRNQSTKKKPDRHCTSQYVLKEADCIDDYSDAPDDEDEDTDLSGFIVDDDAELSYHESVEETSEDEYNSRRPVSKPRRRLQRGHRRVVDSDSDKENNSEVDLADALDGLDIAKERPLQANRTAPEVIDLTSSPISSLHVDVSGSGNFVEDPFASKSCHGVQAEDGSSTTLPSLFDGLLRLSPPRSSRLDTSTPRSRTPEGSSDRENRGNVDIPQRPHTPIQPLTPPRLKSPSKLLSPSKKQTNHRSPHRQSTDAFWDHHTVNDWNDSYSPKKAPIASPRKNPLARFAIWSDNSDEDNGNMDDHDSSSSLPSPCASPTKPIKSPEKAARAAYLAEKRAEKARREAFDAIKDTLARDLVAYLDKAVASGKVSALSESTGGIQIVWSKTLRSTAGRANYRRTVEVPSTNISTNSTTTTLSSTGNDIQTDPTLSSSPTKRKPHHHATIELAEKVIDRESRLVNTLAHEFCHLADFMISAVRNQPHGPSFMSWARKAVRCLQNCCQDQEAGTEGYRPSWQACEISTKHNYEIEWKYLWVCEGRKVEDQTAVQQLLNVEVQQEGGCGAEYGRHSKSINTERMRCGRCKGRLVQVRPLPRASPVKGKVGAKTGVNTKRAGSGSGSRSGSEGSRSSSDGSTGGQLGSMVEVIELSD